MRFLRLTLRHFRGVEHADVAFQPTGVTVVAGPNEAGKSSLAEAVDLLFDYADNSRAQAVKAVSPVHRDEGTEVLLEFQAGTYHATYLKCFNRAPRTELTVHAPRPENHTGREAHDRALAILEESVDLGLWKALRIQQETPLAYPVLDGHGSLAAALDRAAGQARAGQAELSLFAAAEEEYERYWTRGGKERAPLTDAAARVAALGAAVSGLRERLQAVAADVEASAALERRMAGEEEALGELQALALAFREQLSTVESLERTFEARMAAAEVARGAREQAALHMRARRELARRLDAARLEDWKLRAAAAERAPELARLQAEEAAVAEALAAARAAAAAANSAQERAAADLEYRRSQLEHAQLSERLERVRQAAAAARAAEEVVARTPLEAAGLEEIRRANLEVERARAAAEAGSPLLRIQALQRLELRGQDAPAVLAAEEEWTSRVGRPLEVTLGDLARVRVEPAADSRSVQERLRATEATYADLLARAGVADLDSAVRAEREAAEARRQLADRDRVFRNDLRDLTPAELEHKVESLARRVAAYPAEREVAGAAELSLPADFDAAQAARRQAADAAAGAAGAVEAAAGAHAAAQERVRALAGELREQEAMGRQRAVQIQVEREELARAQRERSDAALEAADAAAAAKLGEAERAADAARAELQAAQPDMVRAQTDNAEQAVEAARARLRQDRDERLTLQGRLDAAGQEGLAEKQDAAAIELARAEREEAAVRRRAAAARLLFETLRARRDHARRRYVAPLTERIQTLGSYVFGEDFRIELGQDLSLVERTLDGRTVPFQSLSGGAREQISMLARLACALVVAEDGGVPLVFDDALGNSDAGRLEKLGLVLALAGRTCQVVVLTCAPERYRNVGAATHINLRSAMARPADG